MKTSESLVTNEYLDATKSCEHSQHTIRGYYLRLTVYGESSDFRVLYSFAQRAFELRLMMCFLYILFMTYLLCHGDLFECMVQTGAGKNGNIRPVV